MNSLDQQVAALSPTKRALFEQISRQRPRTTEPIAIVGMACRFPGDANDPESYWKLLAEGRSAVREIPATRWDVDAYYDPNPDAPGRSVSRCGGFLSSVEWFDTELFGIAPRLAMWMDPQHRILLEVAFEALEDAALPPLDLAGTKGGVYVGITSSDFGMMLHDHLPQMEGLAATGVGLHAAAGRLSHAFGLEGPSLAVDTACSSSLVAVHLACQALRLGEVDLALAAGVNLILSPAMTVASSKLHLLSPDGCCRPFDARANGYVRGEGCGVVVLKRMADAMLEKDRVLAVIRGSAVNQGGRISGYGVPNGHSQVAVLRAALGNAGMAASEVGYVEAQGTGTPIGDALEADALAEVFGHSRTQANPLIVGAVKSNIGHLESAAGMASLIKAVLALRRGEVPRNLNLQSLQPDILQRRAPLLFPQGHTPWPRGPKPRTAGVSGFGMAGTNAHVVLQEAPASATSGPAPLDRPTLVVLSGQTSQAVWDHALRLHEALGKNLEISLHELALISTSGRSHLPSRLAVCTSTPAELQRRLGEFLWGRGTGLCTGRAPVTPARVGFVFTGEAADLTSAGRGLHERNVAFRSALDRLSDLARPFIGAPVSQVLWGGLSRSALTASALAAARLALEMALCELWKSFGMIPDMVAGYGAGEYSAACLAGVMSEADAFRLVTERARLWDAHVPDRGALRIHASAEAITPALGTELTITADEGTACVVAGRIPALEALVRALRVERHSVSPCAGPYAATADVGAVAEALGKLAGEMKFRAPLLRLFSGTVRPEVPIGAVPGPAHWVAHLRGPVRFSSMLRAMEQCGCDVFVEVGPDCVLSQLQAGSSRVWVPTLSKGRDDDEVFLTAIANLFVRGAIVDVRKLGRPPPSRTAVLPTYPFQRRRHWLDPAAAKTAVASPRARRDLVRELARSPRQERASLLHRYVVSELTHVLGLEPSTVLREDQPFNELGLDSILAVDLLGALQRDLGIEFPATLFYDFPTLGALVSHLECEFLKVTPPVAAASQVQ